MFDKQIRFAPHDLLDRLLKIVISSLIICVFAPIRLDWSGDLPITLQTLAVLFPAVLFGGFTGGLACLVYLAMILLGLPMRPGYESGGDVLWGFHGGFYQGFLIAAIAVGLLAEKWKAHPSIKQGLLLLLGHAIILGAGLFWKWKMAPPEDALLLLKELGRASILKVAMGWLLLNIIRRLIDRKSSPS